MPSELVNKTVLLLSPSLGNAVAGSIVAEACRAIEADAEALDYTQLIPFLDQLEKILGPRMGPEVSKKTREKIQQSMEKQRQTIIGGVVSQETDAFLQKNALPTESDIKDYAKKLSKRSGGDEGSIEKDLVDKIRASIKSAINGRKINEELDIFLTRYPQPVKTDVDDYINYLRSLKLNFKEDELRSQVENERVMRKFQDIREDESPEIGELMSLIRASKDKKTAGEALVRQGLGYLISDESGVSDRLLSEFVDLIIPNEEGMGKLPGFSRQGGQGN